MVHGELNTKQFTDVKYIQQRIDNHFDVSDVKLKKVEIDDSYPRLLKIILKNSENLLFSKL